ncbi:MAG: hypothetical protein Cons2KO_13370 [Congregibacter sp.]
MSQITQGAGIGLTAWVSREHFYGPFQLLARFIVTPGMGEHCAEARQEHTLLEFITEVFANRQRSLHGCESCVQITNNEGENTAVVTPCSAGRNRSTKLIDALRCETQVFAGQFMLPKQGCRHPDSVMRFAGDQAVGFGGVQSAQSKFMRCRRIRIE